MNDLISYIYIYIYKKLFIGIVKISLQEKADANPRIPIWQVILFTAGDQNYTEINGYE